jgi:cytochrome oxidase Cu insertion factor (SCO1/SenC/PrrC family)
MNSPASSRWRGRLVLLLVAAAFLGSFGVAALLRFSGWQPQGMRNHGELLQPPVALGSLSLKHADGKRFDWHPERNTWRYLVAPAPGCTQACTRTLDALHRLWLSEGRKAERVEVLWLGPLPEGPRFRALLPMQADPGLLARLPQAATPEALPVYLVDPDGYLVLHYRPGFELGGMRKDLGKLVK